MNLIRQADDLYLRLANKQAVVERNWERNWEHMPTVDYKRQMKRLIRLQIKALARLERRLQVAIEAHP